MCLLRLAGVVRRYLIPETRGRAGPIDSFTGLDGETSEPTLAPDGKTLAFQWCKPDYSCGIYTRPLAGGEVRPLIEGNTKEGLATSPRWSPDGGRIAFTRFYSHFDNHLFVRDISSGAERDIGSVCDSAGGHSV
jgi:Tol biopolymer transport system component